MTFISNDKDGVLRLVDFDPGGVSCFSIRTQYKGKMRLTTADPDSFNGERLMLKSEYYGGAPVMASKTIARRRTTEEEIAPQSQIIYGESKSDAQDP
jgi:cleavage and polyadenylation specificity factor subunit 1